MLPYDNPGIVMKASFAAHRRRIYEGRTTPRIYLESCIERINAHEDQVRAFAHLDVPAARRAADESTDRYRHGRALSRIDGMPIGIKDVFDTSDMPTEMGTPFHKGRQPTHDAAHVYALRKGGVVLLGKTVTSQFAIVGNGPTRNPHDLSRSPGATSSGSAAAVAAGMLPVATGSQARGSIIRPASYCGVIGYKPTFGALNRAGCLMATKSYDHLGALAQSLDDLWLTAWHIVVTVGGDPGYPGLLGEPEPPPSRPVGRIGIIETPGWAEAEPAAKEVFAAACERLRDAGVSVATREDHSAIAAYEAVISEVSTHWDTIAAVENRWPLLSYRDRDASLLPPPILQSLQKAATITREDYRGALAYRSKLRTSHARLASEFDLLLTLSSPGPAPVYPDSGSSSFNELATLAGVPALSLPVLSADALPLGLQAIGFADHDYALFGQAAFLTELLKDDH